MLTRSIRSCPLPAQTLLSRYTDRAFTDCHVAELPQSIAQAQFVAALYQGMLMRLERRLIGWLCSKPTSEAQLQALAAGRADSFALWSVEARTSHELLLREQSGRTRSWLMSQEIPGGTRLYFGSALLAQINPKTGARRRGAFFTALHGFHVLYSRLLLSSAATRLSRRRQTG